MLASFSTLAQEPFPEDFNYEQKVEELSERELIKLLSSTQSDLRISAAQRISYLVNNGLNKVAAGNIIENKKGFWESKSIASVFNRYTPLEDGKIRVNTTDLKSVLKDFELDEEDVQESNYDNFVTVQLDHNYAVRFRKVVHTVDLIAILDSPIHFSVLPCKNYSGEWFSFYISGEVYSKAFYDNGIKQYEKLFSVNQNMSSQKFYQNNCCYKIEFYGKSGRCYKVHHELLDEEQANIICTRNFTY